MTHEIRSSVILSVFTLALLGGAATAGADVPSPSVLGAALTVKDPTPIAAIVADPDAWAGKRVRIEGQVTEVCPMAGCWMELAAEKGGHRLKVKVDDGVIVFPTDAVGRVAAAEGVVEIVPMTRDQYRGWLAHLAEERGVPFDESQVGDGPYRIVQLRGTGAALGD